MERSIIGVSLSSLITIIVLVILIGLSNLVPIENPHVRTVTDFLNDNVVTVIVFVLFFFLGELFSIFGFPLNLPGTVFFAYGGYFLTTFIFRLFYLIELLLNLEVFTQIKFFEPILALIVFFVVLIVGIAKIFVKRAKNQTSANPSENQKVEWSDVGNQLKQASYNIAQRINQSSKPKKVEERSVSKKTKEKKDKK